MKAAVRYQYGTLDNLTIAEISKPTPQRGEVLIEVRAVSLNASDFESLLGSPAYVRVFGLFRPKFPILGTDVAGRVVAVGTDVTTFQPGDNVFGDIMGGNGALAEFTCAPAKKLTRKPPHLTFTEAAAIPQAGRVALQGIRDKGNVQPGQSVLINGAGGGAGTFAIQIAKHLGAEVTGVDKAHKLDLMRSLNADHVLDCDAEDFTKSDQRYDLILDLVAYRSIFNFPKVLRQTGTYLLVGGAMTRVVQSIFVGPFLSHGGRKLGILAVRTDQGMDDLLALVKSEAIKPIIDQTFCLDDARAAMRRVLEGKARGKVIVTI